MRNWNPVILRKSVFRARWIYLTYEELKHRWRRRETDSVYRIYLNYEELKLVTRRQVFCKSNRDLSYLWGIETLPFRTDSNCLLWIYLTYEELKLFNVSYGRNSKRRIYLTYEELKPPPCRAGAALRLFGFILPMRNWNSFLGNA